MRPTVLVPLRHAAIAALALAALHLAVAEAPGDDGDAAAGSGNTPWLSPGLRFATPATFGGRLGSGEVRWQRQDESSTWWARVSMGPLRPSEPDGNRSDGVLPAPLLQGEAQWLYRGWERHVVRLGAQARHDLLLPTAQASALGAYVHEEWSVASDWRLALGLRGDGAPAAATTLTPRAALSWQARPDLQLRLVDGLTWRDPNLSIATTSPPAAPPTGLASGVRLHATELALNWQALSELRLAASLDQHRDSATVTAVAPGVLPQPLRFQHDIAPPSPGEGVGVEGEYALVDGWRVNARWTAFQPRSTDEATAGATRLFTALQAHTPLPWRGASAGLEWLRIDQRPGMPAAAALTQTLLNATLAWTPSGSPWSIAANAYNLADHAAAEGAFSSQDALVHEGRRWQLQVARLF